MRGFAPNLLIQAVQLKLRNSQLKVSLWVKQTKKLRRDCAETALSSVIHLPLMVLRATLLERE